MLSTSFRIIPLLAALFLISMGPTPTLAQEQMGYLAPPTVKEYGRPGYPKITVYVWGNADSGVWAVEEGTDLLEFLSVTARTRFSDRNPDERSIELLRMYREGRPGTDDPFFESRIEELFSRRGDYPALQEGDILVLETQTRSRFTWRDITRVVGTVAAILNTYLLLDRLNDGN